MNFPAQRGGNLIALEVNMRLPDGYTTEMFNFGSDINFYEQWANMVTMSSFSTDYQRKFHVAYIGRKWGFDYACSTDQIVELCGKKILNHNYVNGNFSLAIGNFGFIICHPDLEELLKCVILIHELKA